jgi:hypothetical protein
MQEPLAVADLDIVGANEIAAQPFDHGQQCQKVARSSDIVAVEKAEIAPANGRQTRITCGRKS